MAFESLVVSRQSANGSRQRAKSQTAVGRRQEAEDQRRSSWISAYCHLLTAHRLSADCLLDSGGVGWRPPRLVMGRQT